MRTRNYTRARNPFKYTLARGVSSFSIETAFAA